MWKRLTYKQFVQVSGLCGPQLLSYLPKRFTHLCRALYGDAILVYRSWCKNMAAGNQQKHMEFTFSIKALSFHSRTVIYVRINISSNTWNGYTAENQEERLFFHWLKEFLFWCHALWKLGSSICCIFEMKHATGMETSTEIFFVYLQPSVNKNL